MLVAYDGRGFRGFAAQDGVPTVAGALAEAVARTARLDGPSPLVCAGRTDAGVHATGQVVHVDLPASYRGDLARALNRQLAPAVVVRHAAPAAAGFDARRSATARRYRYLVWSAPVPEPLLHGLAWHVPCRLDVRTMASAADPLLGEHDFRAFCRRPPGAPAGAPIVRRVTEARWRELPGGATGWGSLIDPVPPDPPDSPPAPARPVPRGRRAPRAGGAHEGAVAPWTPALLRFDISAGSFCHQMVRSIVAVLVEAGRGRASAATVMALLTSGSRAGAPRPAPPEGLCLVEVDYGGIAAPAGGPARGPETEPVPMPGADPGLPPSGADR